jgi:hypothetical protein
MDHCRFFWSLERSLVARPLPDALALFQYTTLDVRSKSLWLWLAVWSSPVDQLGAVFAHFSAEIRASELLQAIAAERLAKSASVLPAWVTSGDWPLVVATFYSCQFIDAVAAGLDPDVIVDPMSRAVQSLPVNMASRSDLWQITMVRSAHVEERVADWLRTDSRTDAAFEAEFAGDRMAPSSLDPSVFLFACLLHRSAPEELCRRVLHRILNRPQRHDLPPVLGAAAVATLRLLRSRPMPSVLACWSSSTARLRIANDDVVHSLLALVAEVPQLRSKILGRAAQFLLFQSTHFDAAVWPADAPNVLLSPEQASRALVLSTKSNEPHGSAGHVVSRLPANQTSVVDAVLPVLYRVLGALNARGLDSDVRAVLAWLVRASSGGHELARKFLQERIHENDRTLEALYDADRFLRGEDSWMRDIVMKQIGG